MAQRYSIKNLERRVFFFRKSSRIPLFVEPHGRSRGRLVLMMDNTGERSMTGIHDAQALYDAVGLFETGLEWRKGSTSKGYAKVHDDGSITFPKGPKHLRLNQGTEITPSGFPPLRHERR